MIGRFEASRQRLLESKGRTFTITRDGGSSTTLLGFFSVWTAEQMAGTVLRQGDVRIDVLASDLGSYPIPPRDPDLITVANTYAYTCLFANSIHEGEKLIGWAIAARGE